MVLFAIIDILGSIPIIIQLRNKAGHIQSEKASIVATILMILFLFVGEQLLAIIGMLPIALAQGTASEWKNGLAWVIIGGLLSSMILTVYLVPMVYDVVDTIKLKIANYELKK